MPPKKSADPFALMNGIVKRSNGAGRRKVRDPNDPKEAERLRALHPEFDEIMGSANVDYKTMCKTDAEFARKFAIPPVVDPVRAFREHTNSVDAVAWGPDPGTFVSGSHDATMRVWDAASGRCLDKLEGHGGGIFHVAVAESGRAVISCGIGEERKNVLIWEWPRKKVAKYLRGHHRPVHHVSISKCSTFACCADQDGQIAVYDVYRGERFQERTVHLGVVHGTCFSPENPNLILSAGRDGCMHLHDLREQPQTAAWRLPSAPANSVFVRACLGVDCAHDGLAIQAVEFNGSNQVITGGADCKLKRWDLRKAVAGAAKTKRGQAPPANCADEYLGHSSGVRSLALSPDGRFTVTGCEDGSCRLWHTGATATPSLGYHTAIRTLNGHVGIVAGCAWQDDASKRSASVLSCSWDQTVQLFTFPTSDLV